MNLLTFQMADKIVDHLPGISRSQCDMWCDQSGFEICVPSQFKLAIGLQNGRLKIERLLVKQGQADTIAQKMVDIVAAVIRVGVQFEKPIYDISLRPEISTRELDQGFVVVTKLQPVVIGCSDHLAATA